MNKPESKSEMPEKVPHHDQMSSVLKHCGWLRELINEPRRKHLLMKNSQAWSQLCASLDVIKDCSLAIMAFPIRNDEGDPGKYYLGVYGLLQSLIIQQDATENMCEALGIKVNRDDYPQLKAIRNIRVKAAGHPSKMSEKNGLSSYHGLIQSSLSYTNFEMFSYLPDGTTEFKQLSIPKIIDEQADQISDLLKSIISKLKKDDEAYRAMFMNDKLADSFPDQIGYYFQNVYEGIFTETSAKVAQGIVGFNMLKNALNLFREKLNTRGIDVDTYPGIEECLNNLEHPMKQVEFYLQARRDSKSPAIVQQEAEIFTEYIQNQFNELKDMTEEIDRDL